MESSKPVHEYETHDFKAVNRHVDELSKRASVATSARRAEVFKTYAVYGALLAVGLGFATWLILLGIAVLTDPEPEVIVQEVVVEKPVAFEPNIYITERGTDVVAVDVKRGEAQSVVTSIQGREPGSGKITYNYVIFKETPFTEDGFERVMIGMEYENSDSDLPSEQWCYIERVVGNATSKQVSLSSKAGRNRIDNPVTSEMASELSTSVETLQAAQTQCRFL